MMMMIGEKERRVRPIRRKKGNKNYEEEGEKEVVCYLVESIGQ
jgi:hypothetical protein